HRDIVLVSGRELDSIATAHLAFVQHGEVEARTPAGQEALDHVISTESHAELVAGHSGLRDAELGRTHPETVADPAILIEKALGREVLPERPPRQIHSRKLPAPALVVLGGVGVDSLVRA